MGAGSDTPQEAFARFVRRAIDEARQRRGWTTAELAGHTGLGRSTLFRWMAGDWQDYPELAKVRSFCAALDLPVGAAFRALGLPGSATAARSAAGRSAAREVAASRSRSTGSTSRDRAATRVDDDIRAILDRLADPRVSSAEKKDIRDTLHHLARRPLRWAG
ncbi:multiprotein-bridging factor 1 family protein [Plantactinospora sp. GCM10030261]|uniref:helix-turn-helix domain-containing protein n=1 Tax=Plantactinospora sp. GCM10030261 TaxID=3273420 RepID=UPI003622B07A